MEPNKSLVRIKANSGEQATAGLLSFFAGGSALIVPCAIMNMLGVEKDVLQSFLPLCLGGSAFTGLLVRELLIKELFRALVKDKIYAEKDYNYFSPKYKVRRTLRTKETKIIGWQDSYGRDDRVTLITNWKGIYLESIKQPDAIAQWDKSMQTVETVYSLTSKKYVKTIFV